MALSLRTLMVLVLVVGGPLGWLARRVAVQRRAVAIVRGAGGGLIYSDQYDASGKSILKVHEPGGPVWLRRVVGDEPFEEVVGVSFDARRGSIRLDEITMDAVASFDRLQTFFVNGPAVAPSAPLARPLAAKDLARLAGLTRLRQFRVYDIAIDGAVMDLLPSWPSLTEVSVVSSEQCLPGSSLRVLGRLPRLKAAIITALKSSTSADLAPVLALPLLTEVIIGRAPVSDAGLATFAARPGLATLHLWGTEVTEPTLTALAQNPTLDTLSFDAGQLPPGGLRHLAGATHLKMLTVMLGGQPGTPGWHPSYHRSAPRFKDADLDVLHGLPLKAFGMAGLDATDAGVGRFLAAHQLSMMTLGGQGVTDASVPALLSQSKIFYLTLTDTSLTDDGLARLATHPDLHSLTILDNRNLTDGAIAALAGCRQLKELTIRQRGVTPTALDSLRLARPRSGPVTITRVPDAVP